MGGILIALALDLIAFLFGAKLIHKGVYGHGEEKSEKGCGLCKVCGYIVLIASAILFIFTFVGIILAAFGVAICPGAGHMGPGMMQPSMMGGGGMMMGPGMMQQPGMMKPPEARPEEGKIPPIEKQGETPKATPETK